MVEKTIISKPQDEFMGLALTADAVVAQQDLVKAVIRKVMKKDVHFGIIPGCMKPSLYKPGAEVLNLTFRLSPDYASEITMDGKHMTVRSKCTLTHIPSGRVFGSGEALCTTKEKKYRIRKDQGKIVENGNLEDCYNTVLKIGNKRALIAAVLNVTACSDEFTQDMGEETEPLVVVDTDGTVKENTPAEVVQKAEESHAEKKANGYQPEPSAKEPEKQAKSGTWKGKVEDVIPKELPDGTRCWSVKGADGKEFVTADPAFEETFDGVESGKEYQIKWKLSGKGNLIIQGMKDAG